MLSIKKQIHVTNFSIDVTGIKISYVFNGALKQIAYDVKKSAIELKEAGVIEYWEETEFGIMVRVEDKHYYWEEYADEVGMYQYAAILLAVNYEMTEQQRREARQKPSSLFELFAGISRADAKARGIAL